MLTRLRDELGGYVKHFTDAQLAGYYQNAKGSFEGTMRLAIRRLLGIYSNRRDVSGGEWSEKRAQEYQHLREWYDLYGDGGSDPATVRGTVSFWRTGRVSSPRIVSERRVQ